ncbi:14523_t:CDS:2, partial [Funneliformis geosporum]
SVNQNLKEYYPTDEEWQTIYQIIALLEPMEKGTQLLCVTNFPTLALVHRVFNGIQYHLDNSENAKNKLQMIFTSYSTTFTTENIHIPVSTSQNLNKYFASLNNRNSLTANNLTQISSEVEQYLGHINNPM